MQENTHVHRCLVAEEPAGVFHSSRIAGAWTARVPDKKQRKGRVTENLREGCVALFLLHLPLALVLRCPTFPRWRGQNLMFGNHAEIFVAAAAAVWQLRNTLCRSCWWPFCVVGYSFEARHQRRPTAYYGRTLYFQIIITASEVLLPNNHLFYSLGAANLVHLTGQTLVFAI